MDEEVEMAEPRADEANQSDHLWVSCPKCLRANLRIRRAHLGKRVLCKHCGEHFRARTAHDPSANASATQVILPAPLPSATARAEEKRAAVLENKLDQLRSEDLEQQLERAREQLQQATALHDELGVVRLENARLRAAVAQLGSQVADRGRREDELWSELQENRIHLQETGAQCASSDHGSIEAKARETEELRTERDRLAAGRRHVERNRNDPVQRTLDPAGHDGEEAGRRGNHDND